MLLFIRLSLPPVRTVQRKIGPPGGKTEADAGDGNDDAAVRGFHRIPDDRIHIDHLFEIFHRRSHQALKGVFRHVPSLPLRIFRYRRVTASIRCPKRKRTMQSRLDSRRLSSKDGRTFSAGGRSHRTCLPATETSVVLIAQAIPVSTPVSAASPVPMVVTHSNRSQVTCLKNRRNVSWRSRTRLRRA